VSVDVETSGPNPSEHSLLALGACLVADPSQTFYVELQPTTQRADPRAMPVHGLSLKRLASEGLPAAQAMTQFEAWLQAQLPSGTAPIFVGFNAPFDWMFVNDYFHRFLGRNPFGHSALDLKSFFMGMTGVDWAETSKRFLEPRYAVRSECAHHALADAVEQAGLFRHMLGEQARLSGREADDEH
jgi:DNA polymerase III epsilon subunit-like protein